MTIKRELMEENEIEQENKLINTSNDLAKYHNP
jgi:hypothetical protein